MAFAEIAVKLSVRAGVSQGLEDPLTLWLTHMADELVLVIGPGSHFFPCGPLHRFA